MNKIRFPGIAAGALAGALCTLILAGCDVLTNPDYVETIDLLPSLPYARIIEDLKFDAVDNPLGWNDTRFVLEWRRQPGRVIPGAVVDQQVIDEAALAVLDKWMEYIARVDPHPFINDSGDGLSSGSGNDTEVFESSGGGPNTNYAIDKENVVIHRYWPASAGAPPTDWASFMATAEHRETMYDKAVAEIKAMRMAIKDSPFYAENNPLDALYEAMGTAIPDLSVPGSTAPSGQKTDKWGAGDFDINLNLIIPVTDGYLYHYYLGYIPKKDDWDMYDADKGIYIDRP
ncbi:hypothetical protein FACS1894110_04160 [Spirochaetia bacterium]|nr:hypothetical protein FACS1894110_04160 [Spirochaetia bacterium]